MTVTERRIDTYRAKVERTQEGYAILRGVAAVPGVLEYHYDDRIVRELVLKDVLSSDENIKSLIGAPLCSGHPPVAVSSSNWTQYAKGSVRAAAWDDREDGTVVECIAQDATLIHEIIEGGLEELSCGYDVGIDQVSGVHEIYGPYDQFQVWRRNNHLAAVHEARAGERARFHFDSADHKDKTLAFRGKRLDSSGVENPKRTKKMETKIKIDEVEFEVDQTLAIALRAERRADAANLERAAKEIQGYKDQMSKLQSKKDELEAEIVKMNEQLAKLLELTQKKAEEESTDKTDMDKSDMDKSDVDDPMMNEMQEAYGDLLLELEMESEGDEMMNEDSKRGDAAQRRLELINTAVDVFGFNRDSTIKSNDLQIKRACVAHVMGKDAVKKFTAAEVDSAYVTVRADALKRADAIGRSGLQSATDSKRGRQDSSWMDEEAKLQKSYRDSLTGKNA